MNEPSEQVASPGPAPALRGHIRFEQVSYRYAGDAPGRSIEVDLEIAPGQVLGVVGLPGSGKSTFAKLLLGLDQPEHGRVLIDDLDVRLWSPAVLRQQIGVVPQEVQLFAGSIAENIALGAADRPFERIVAAAKFVGAHDFVQRLPAGYDTRLSERGGGLSAGQRQLISIARRRSATRASWCSTRRPAASTLRPRRACWSTSSAPRAAAPSSWSPTAWPRSRSPTGWSCSPTAAWSATASSARSPACARPPVARRPHAAPPGAGLMLRQLRERLTGARRFGEFLPDAEGVVERGHSPIAGLLILAISAGLRRPAGVVGADRGRAGGAGRGQVEPAGRVKIINHPDGGRIAEVHVVEGQRVAAGAPLLTFDPELVRTQLAELTGRLEVKSAEAARLRGRVRGRRAAGRSRARRRPARPGRAAGAAREPAPGLCQSRRRPGPGDRATAQRARLDRRPSSRLGAAHGLLSEQLDAIRGLAEKGPVPPAASGHASSGS